jgi:3-methyl-2-oxobutanoate hydroxymethyltransferase
MLSSVIRGVDRALVIVVDLPFGSYQGNSKEALTLGHSCDERESGAHAVKIRRWKRN